ncbi:MAG: nucleotidyltransferase substrate binding protein, partial [Cyanobacteria bacterium J06598_3]
MSDLDIRWQQRFSSYQKALAQLTEFIDKGNLNKLEEQGLIKAFEYTYELAWNTLEEYLSYQGIQDITGSRDAFRT